MSKTIKHKLVTSVFIFLVFISLTYGQECGDASCDADETCSSCPQDCDVCPPICGDGICESQEEDKCKEDCDWCGDGECNADETCSICQQDCGNCCGNAQQDLEETCQNCPADIKCSNNEDCSPTRPDANEVGCASKCGNGGCEEGECASCFKDCNIQQCTGNNQCNYEVGENCQNTPNDCQCDNTQICDPSRVKVRINGCYKIRCGDKYIDRGETQQTCCRDAGCPPDKLCHNNKCVQCGEDSDCSWGRCSPRSNTCVRCIEDGDCGSGKCNTLTNECVECLKDDDCSETTKWSDSFSCSPDFTSVIQKGEYINGKCDLESSTCLGHRQEDSKIYTNCLSKGLYCQNGKCGCDRGYSACKPLKKCIKIGDLDDNKPCSCDFQCKSEYCVEERNCITPLNVVLSSTKNALKVGEETSVSLSVDNNLNKDVNANIAINIGDGVEMSDVISGMDCSGNQCKISKMIVARGRDEITIRLLAKTANVVPLTAQVTYFMDDGKERAITDIKSISIPIVECGDSTCTEGETTQNCCMDCGCQKSNSITNYECTTKGCKGKLRPIWTIIILGLIITFGTIVFVIIKNVIRWFAGMGSGLKSLSIKKICTKCHKTMRDGADFCHNCGTKGYVKKVKDLSHLFKEDKQKFVKKVKDLSHLFKEKDSKDLKKRK